MLELILVLGIVGLLVGGAISAAQPHGQLVLKQNPTEVASTMLLSNGPPSKTPMDVASAVLAANLNLAVFPEGTKVPWEPPLMAGDKILGIIHGTPLELSKDLPITLRPNTTDLWIVMLADAPPPNFSVPGFNVETTVRGLMAA